MFVFKTFHSFTSPHILASILVPNYLERFKISLQASSPAFLRFTNSFSNLPSSSPLYNSHVSNVYSMVVEVIKSKIIKKVSFQSWYAFVSLKSLCTWSQRYLKETQLLRMKVAVVSTAIDRMHWEFR